MKDIQVGDRVRFLDNPNVDGYLYEPTDSSKNLNLLTAEDLRDQLGTVIETRLDSMTDDEVMVKLDDGRKVNTNKRNLGYVSFRRGKLLRGFC